MRVFLAGATGAIGRSLTPLLVEQGHAVTGLARNADRQRTLEAMGAGAVIADPLDREGLTEAIHRAAPEALIHELTALQGVGDFKRLDDEFTLTNRLRTETLDTMLAAAAAIGAKRFIAQSFCGWPFAREGGRVKTEDDPLDPDPPKMFRRTLAAIRHLEGAVRASAVVPALALRYGALYGPGTSIALDGIVVDLVRKRRLPIVGGGGGVWSFVHIEDAAAATVRALTHGRPGIYNIVDDEPAPVSEWLPALAEAVGAKHPRRLPRWIGRLAIGEGGVSMMTRVRGGSNAKARRELEWRPRYSSWRRGFVEGLE